MTLAFLLGAAFGLPGCQEAKQAFDTKFKESFVKSFGPSCTTSAMKGGAPESLVKPMCECMGTYLAEHYTPAELTKLSTNTTSPEVGAMVKAATSACHVGAPQEQRD